jgi:hypothetical protein
MAVSDVCPGFEVTIDINEYPPCEYTDETTSTVPKTVLKYIEVLPGAEFSVIIEFKNPSPMTKTLKSDYTWTAIWYQWVASPRGSCIGHTDTTDRSREL